MNLTDIFKRVLAEGMVLSSDLPGFTPRVLDLILPRGRGSFVVAFNNWWVHQDQVPNPCVAIYTVELEPIGNQYRGTLSVQGTDYTLFISPLDDDEDRAQFNHLRSFTDRADVRAWYAPDLGYLAANYDADIDDALALLDARPTYNLVERTRERNTAVRDMMAVTINGPDGVEDVVVCDALHNAAAASKSEAGDDLAREWIRNEYQTLAEFAKGVAQRSLYGALAYGTPELIQAGGTVTAVAISRAKRNLAST